jgi:hypothetical protein
MTSWDPVMAPAIGWVWAGQQLIAPTRLGRSFRWRLASSWDEFRRLDHFRGRPAA